MLQELQPKLDQMLSDLQVLGASESESDQLLYNQLQKSYNETLAECWNTITPSDRVFLARRLCRPNGRTVVEALTTDFFELHGDRLGGDNNTVLGGVARFEGLPVTVLALCKGETQEEQIYYNFGMASPSGYRKIQRLAKQAEKFGRPIITIIDTPGAYPGIEAEEQGQGEAIASCLALFSDLSVPVIAVIIGEGGSGGALALGVANRVLMLENAVYSILSPEGFATILWKDVKRKDEASEIMKLTAQDLLELGIIDTIIPEGIGGIERNKEEVIESLRHTLHKELTDLLKLSPTAVAKDRYDRFRKMGSVKNSIF
ncbi:MAG: acetyl-CoA carboxylase carboxyltransferase subunit alpha [Eubacteriales bacterium]